MDEGGSKRQGYSQNQLVCIFIVIAVQPFLNNHLGTEESDRHQEVAVVERLKQESIYGPVSNPDLEIREGRSSRPQLLVSLRNRTAGRRRRQNARV